MKCGPVLVLEWPRGPWWAAAVLAVIVVLVTCTAEAWRQGYRGAELIVALLVGVFTCTLCYAVGIAVAGFVRVLRCGV